MSIRQRLYPAVDALPVLELHCAQARFIWNLALEQAQFHPLASIRDRQHKPPGSAARMKQLTEARAASDWLASGSTVIQQGVLRDFDRALQNWWGGSHRRPTWRKAKLHNGFIVRDLTVDKINHRWAQITVPKVGPVRFRWTRTWQSIAACTSARITLDRAGRWWVSLTCPPPAFTRHATGAAVGIDRGCTNSIATSDGQMGHAPNLSRGEQARFLALQQRLARQKKGSRRREATRRSLARMHATLAGRRQDWTEKTSTALARKFDVIVIEQLRTRDMTRRPKPKPDETPGSFLPNGARAKAALNRMILASCWGALAQRLTHKTACTPADNPSVLVEVNPRNTSRTCADCGYVAGENRESQAVFTCQSCGHEAHADTNAAINILRRANLTATPKTAEPQPRGTDGRP